MGRGKPGLYSDGREGVRTYRAGYDYTDLFRVPGDGRHQERYSRGTTAAWYKQSLLRNAAFAGLDNGLDDRARSEAAARVRYRTPGATPPRTRPRKRGTLHGNSLSTLRFV